jgi:hypothetical protein
VDIELMYLLVDDPRETALKKMTDALGRIAASMKKTISARSPFGFPGLQPLAQSSNTPIDERVVICHGI